MQVPYCARHRRVVVAVHVRNNYRDFVDWFAARCTTQAHSAKDFEDMVKWALETDAQTLILTMLADVAAPVRRRDQPGACWLLGGDVQPVHRGVLHPC